jgi:hypothetical protein
MSLESRIFFVAEKWIIFYSANYHYTKHILRKITEGGFFGPNSENFSQFHLPSCVQFDFEWKDCYYFCKKERFFYWTSLSNWKSNFVRDFECQTGPSGPFVNFIEGTMKQFRRKWNKKGKWKHVFVRHTIAITIDCVSGAHYVHFLRINCAFFAISDPLLNFHLV